MALVSKKQKTFAYYDTLIFILIVGAFFGYIGFKMGISNMFSTIMQTAYRLLIDTVFYIMAVAVLAGAFGKLANEFGLTKLLNRILAPLMRPLFNMPGVAFLGIITTYLSDNPAIISLAKDDSYLEHFTENEVPCLCNLGTAFGMGLIVTTFMIGLGYLQEALVGNIGALIGCIVSVRLMSYKARKAINKGITIKRNNNEVAIDNNNRNKSFFERFLTAFLDGGKLGVDIGMNIIPGVLVICTVIMILTFGPLDPSIGYQGKAYEGVQLLPKMGKILSPIIKPLFGFKNPEAIAFPITALGAVGAALSLIPKFIQDNMISSNDIAVFTAMGMCWSGFLSTHVAMFDVLGHKELISKAIFSHLIGGIVAGISAHYILIIINLF